MVSLSSTLTGDGSVKVRIECIYPAKVQDKVIFKWSETGLNFVFSFSYTGCLNNAKETSWQTGMDTHEWIHTFP